MTILENLQDYVDDYREKLASNLESREPKLVFVVTGTAMEVLRLAQVPGASDILEAIFVPYSGTQSIEFIAGNFSKEASEAFKEKAVSEYAAAALCKAGLNKWENCKVIAVTGATITNRPRKGLHHAYISCGRNYEYKEWIGGYEKNVINSSIDTHYLQMPHVSDMTHRNMSKADISEYRKNEDKTVTEFALGLAFNAFRKVKHVEYVEK